MEIDKKASDLNILNINQLLNKNEIIGLICNNELEKNQIFDKIMMVEKYSSDDKKKFKKFLKIFYLFYNKKGTESSRDAIYLKKDNLSSANIYGDLCLIKKQNDLYSLSNLLEHFLLDISILKKHFLELSESELQKILIVFSIISDKKIIILDNPNLYLDKHSKTELLRLLKTIKRNNKTIIISSTDSNFLLQIVDRVIYINDYNIVYNGSKYDFFSNNNYLNKVNMEAPKLINFILKTKKLKNIKLKNTDNINDLIKDVYRNAK